MDRRAVIQLELCGPGVGTHLVPPSSSRGTLGTSPSYEANDHRREERCGSHRGLRHERGRAGLGRYASPLHLDSGAACSHRLDTARHHGRWSGDFGLKPHVRLWRIRRRDGARQLHPDLVDPRRFLTKVRSFAQAILVDCLYGAGAHWSAPALPDPSLEEPPRTPVLSDDGPTQLSLASPN